MSRLRIGIIGGGIANGKHLPSLKALNRADIVAFCDLIPERAEKAAKEYAAQHGKPDVIFASSVHPLTLEECLEFIDDDELLEITPKSLRMRKRVLSHEQRAKDLSRLKK